jgi:hypothetical protein
MATADDKPRPESGELMLHRMRIVRELSEYGSRGAPNSTTAELAPDDISRGLRRM